MFAVVLIGKYVTCWTADILYIDLLDYNSTVEQKRFILLEILLYIQQSLFLIVLASNHFDCFVFCVCDIVACIVIVITTEGCIAPWIFK